MLETLKKEMAIAEEETEMNRVASLKKFRDEFQGRCHTATSRNISRVPPILAHEPTAHTMHTHVCNESHDMSRYTPPQHTHQHTCVYEFEIHSDMHPLSPLALAHAN